MYFDYTHLHSFPSSYHIHPCPTPSQYHVLLFVFNNPLSPICTFGLWWVVHLPGLIPKENWLPPPRNHQLSPVSQLGNKAHEPLSNLYWNVNWLGLVQGAIAAVSSWVQRSYHAHGDTVSLQSCLTSGSYHLSKSSSSMFPSAILEIPHTHHPTDTFLHFDQWSDSMLTNVHCMKKLMWSESCTSLWVQTRKHGYRKL